MNLTQDKDTGASPERWSPPTSVGVVDRSSLVAALMGLGACLLTGGLVARFGVLFETADAHRIGVSGALFCLALGSLLPHRLAALLGGRRRGDSADGLATGRDQVLLWAVLAIVALLSGLCTALLPAWAPLAESGYRWALARFLWPQWSLPFLQLFAVVLLSVTPLALAGVTLSCVCRAACPWRDSISSTTPSNPDARIQS